MSGMPRLDDEDDRKSVVLDDLRLVFFWQGDRWIHSIDLFDQGKWTRLVSTIEAGESPDPARVVSPSYQQFHWQETGQTALAMLVGQSGPHHFSAVFAFHIEPNAAVMTVEVADRCLSPVEALASTYLVDLPSGHLQDANDAEILWSLERPHATLGFAAGSGSQLALAEAGRRATRVQANALLKSGESTQHFVYHWRWSLRNETG